jgi:RNA polymerase sigma-70 factor, ECF subfamily
MSALTKLEENIPALRRYAFALLRNQTDADDLVQDCLVRALDHMDERTGEGEMRPWLFSIMHNLCVSRWRRLRFRSSIVVSGTEADVSVPASQQATAELHAALNNLDQLPEEQREVLLLVAVEGLEYADAAKVLKIPVGTVMSRLSRARDKLRDTMEGRQRPALRRVK